MDLTVHLNGPYIWYNKEFKIWRISINICGPLVSSSVSFSNKNKNKVKKNFYKWAIEGPLGDEMYYLFKENKIYFKKNVEEENDR